MRFRECAVGLGTMLVLAVPARAQVTINFDDLLDGAVVTTQYAALGATFSSDLRMVNYVTTQGIFNGSKPNFLCTGISGSGIDCTRPTYVDFSSAVSGLSFLGLGINDVSPKVAQARVYAGLSLIGTIDIAGNAELLDPVLVDFGALGGITRLEIDQITDAAGIGWDDFTFTVGATTAPEPATIALLATGLLAVAGVARRRRV